MQSSLTIIPVSTLITHTIDQTYETSIQETIDNAVSSSKEEFIDEQTESKTYGIKLRMDSLKLLILYLLAHQKHTNGPKCIK